MNSKIEIFRSKDNNIELRVAFDADTVWLSQEQMGELFGRNRVAITQHIGNIFREGELDRELVCKDFLRTTQHGAIKGKSQTKSIKLYNLDVIISVGYRVKSQRGTHFRQWATQRLRDYLVQGYAINEKRLAQKQLEVEYLKTGIRILKRAMVEQTTTEEYDMLRVFARGLDLLDDFDHETLDKQGQTLQEAKYPSYGEYMELIAVMYSEFDSGVFAMPKDDSFQSSINQIKQGYDQVEFYPSLEDKAANLLYLITKNHSFVDGNKRIAAACFLYFLKKNNALYKPDGNPIIDSATLAALTLFIATSKTEEADIVKQLTISILNRSKS